MFGTQYPLEIPEIAHLDRALRHALARHESALGRLRYELPTPSQATLTELEAAETLLRETQARRDAATANTRAARS